MRSFVFPGQGSQAKGMGKDLFEKNVTFLKLECDIDRIVGFSLRELCLNNPDNKLNITSYTQPCLYVVNALGHIQEMESGRAPDFLAGHSLGEYNALLAAGVFDFLTGLEIVRKRGELMARARGGGMVAVIGLPSDRIMEVIKGEGLGTIDIANFNSPFQTVIAGPVSDLEAASVILENAGARMCIPLQVSAAFHSRYMAEAADEFSEFLVPYSFVSPSIPVVSNVTARPYPLVNASDEIKRLLVAQITAGVRWHEVVDHLIVNGVTDFHEVGPGATLSKLIVDIRSNHNS